MCSDYFHPFSFCFPETVLSFGKSYSCLGPFTAFSLCCEISGEAESRRMPCPSPLHISKRLTKKVSITYSLSVGKESEIEGGQVTSLTHQGNQ